MRTLEQLLCLWKCHEVWKSGTVDLCGELDLETGVSDSVCGTQLCHVPVCLCGSVHCGRSRVVDFGWQSDWSVCLGFLTWITFMRYLGLGPENRRLPGYRRALNQKQSSLRKG